MKKVLKPLTLAAAVSAALVSGHVAAYEAGDWIVRAGATQVAPDEDSSEVLLNGGGIGTEAEVDNNTQLGLTVEYMYTANWGIEVLAATPFSHTVSGKGGVLNGLDVADIEHLPPTVSAVYHFDTQGNLDPYVGVGINYTAFFSEDLASDTAGAVTTGDVDLDDSWGLALQVGVDYQINEKWLVNASVRWIDIDTEAEIKFDNGAVAEVDVDIDPMVYSVMVGYKF
ncbi:MAG: outer membrane protein OmpW [Candidatus Pelagadaptatus aseana]|uniref:OmpW/AlkL family protein n=1 Tax=Candidatus Pelagadaptatus aseana TaxID=3120508 RepID=UPI0039B1AABA